MGPNSTPHKWLHFIRHRVHKRFFEATKKYPNKLYANLTKVFLKKSEEVKEQLKENNIDCNEIKHIVISHFHADHVSVKRF